MKGSHNVRAPAFQKLCVNTIYHVLYVFTLLLSLFVLCAGHQLMKTGRIKKGKQATFSKHKTKQTLRRLLSVLAIQDIANSHTVDVWE